MAVVLVASLVTPTSTGWAYQGGLAVFALVSVALIAAILLQARGTGLSGTFGGDSAVYRSRRGVERRLWQFTILLLVLFILFSVIGFAAAS